jgi:hypothetical protein
MQATIPAVLLVALCSSGAHCGPTPEESGQTVLLVAPFVVLCAMAVQWLILALWRSVRPALLLDWRKNLALVGGLAFPAAWALLVNERPFDFAGIAFWLFGCSYVTAMLLATRIWLLVHDTRRVFFVTHVILCVIFLVPAFVLALFGGRPLQNAAEAMWIFPGFGGWISGPLFLVLLLEIVIRREMLRRRGSTGPADPPSGSAPTPGR